MGPVIAAGPHVGFLLLRMCAGFAAGGRLARAIGPLPEFTQIDSASMSALAPLVPLDERTQAIARLPFRLGLGIRSPQPTPKLPPLRRALAPLRP